MKYKVGDRVRIKSLDWYNENKDKFGVSCSTQRFTPNMSWYCGKILIISCIIESKGCYKMLDAYYYWTDEMIEGLVEEETTSDKVIEEAKTYWDSIKDAWICPEGYQFKDENGNIINATKIVLEKKKKEYPKTYAECCKIIGIKLSDCYIQGYKSPLLEDLQELLICRDAYWKLYGEEMGLGKPWKPNWEDESDKFTIEYFYNNIDTDTLRTYESHMFAFPTKKMRDAFKENFDPGIEICKELL